MVLLTIFTCSKYWTIYIKISLLPPFGPFPRKGNGTYMEPFHEKLRLRTYRSYIDFQVSHIHLKDVTIIQNIFLSVDPDKSID